MKTQGRKYRILTGFLAPPIIAVILLYFFLLLNSSGDSDVRFASGFLLLGIPLAFTLAGVQSLIFALLMEYVINPKIRKKWQKVCCAGLLGVISGGFVGWIFGMVGMLVGFGLGWHLSHHFQKSVNKALHRTP
jgi:uncharacterized membrane protein